MLERIKILLNKVGDNSVDATLRLLMNMCREEAYTYCNLDEYDEALDNIVIEMVIERFNRIGSEGASSQSTSGVSMSYYDSYSGRVLHMLNKHRRVKCV